MEAYPLYWPQNFNRNKIPVSSKFKTTLPSALKNVRNSLNAFSNDSGFKIEGMVISSNVSLGNEKPKDCGVAVWFVWDKKQLCIAVDKYTKVEDNLQAIYHIIEARRTELRHGGLNIVRQTFTGFKALPPAKEKWHEVLGVNEDAVEKDVRDAYRTLAKKHHPDVGGNTSDWERITKAYEAFKTTQL